MPNRGYPPFLDPVKLSHLVALAEHGTTHRAAQAVGLSQPALSRSIRALERDTGTVLVEQVGRRLVLTEAGRFLAQNAGRVMFDHGQLLRAVRLASGGERGIVRLGVSLTPAALLWPFARELSLGRPRVSVSIISGATDWLAAELRRGNLDIVAGDAPDLEGDPLLDVEVFPPVTVGFYCSPSHPVLRQSPITLASLNGYQVAVGPLGPGAIRSFNTNVGPELDLRSLETFVSSDPGLMRHLATTSETIIGVAEVMVRSELVTGRLVRVPIPEVTNLGHRYAVARLAGRTDSPTMALFRKKLREALAEGPVNVVRRKHAARGPRKASPKGT